VYICQYQRHLLKIDVHKQHHGLLSSYNCHWLLQIAVNAQLQLAKPKAKCASIQHIPYLIPTVRTEHDQVPKRVLQLD
jgi:hypothetical protein